jgi:hypothetical protein
MLHHQVKFTAHKARLQLPFLSFRGEDATDETQWSRSKLNYKGKFSVQEMRR